MARSYRLALKLDLRDRRGIMRAVIGLLLVANVAALLMWLKPWGGSASDLAQEMDQRRRELAIQNARLERTRSIAAKVEKARSEGDRFLTEYTIARRAAFSTLIADLDAMAVKAGMRPRESSFIPETVEGSNEALVQLTISVNYEGSYASLTQFIRALDKSNRFLIIQSLQAAPLPSGVLAVNLRLDTFVRQPQGGVS